MKRRIPSATVEDVATSSPDASYGPVSGAQLLAEENVNTVKRSPKHSNQSMLASDSLTTKEEIPENPAISIPITPADPHTQEESHPPAAPKYTKDKPNQATKDESNHSSSNQTDSLKINENSTDILSVDPMENRIKNISISPYESLNKSNLERNPQTTEDQLAGRTQSESKQIAGPSHAEQDSSLSISNLKVKPKAARHITEMSGELATSSGSVNYQVIMKDSTSASVSNNQSQDGLASSGESDDDERMILAPRVSLERHQLLPNLLTQVNSHPLLSECCDC